jgi:hypothetical protein
MVTSPVQQIPAAPTDSNGSAISPLKTILIRAASLGLLWVLGAVVAVVLDRP